MKSNKIFVFGNQLSNVWTFLISSFILVYSGPEGTCFEGGVFPARLLFPPDYPLSPPKMKFTCDMFHPNSKLYKISEHEYLNIIHY